MHPGGALSTAVAILVTGVALQPPGGGVLEVLGLLGLSAWWVGELPVEVGLAVVSSSLVPLPEPLTGVGNRRAATVLVLVEGVRAVGSVVSGGVADFDQGVGHDHKKNQDP